MAKLKATALKVEPRLEYKENKSLDILPYDFDNKYPQRVKDIINDSPTGKTCLKLKKKFVFGGGVKDLTFYKSMANDKQTIDKFLRKLVSEISDFGGVAIHCNFNGLGEILDATIVPFEYVRRSYKTSTFKIYDDWGNVKHKSIQNEEVIEIKPFDLSNVIREAEEVGFENYKGQLFYFNGDEDIYNLAPVDAILENMLTDGQLKKFKHSAAAKNFMASHLLVMGKQESLEAEEQFDENLRSFQGGEGAGTIMIVEKESNDETIELQKVDIQDYDGLYEYTEKSSKETIYEQFLIPPVLFQKASGGIGTSKEISEAFDYYNTITADERLIVEEILTLIFSNWFTNINPSNDYSILPLRYRKQIGVEYLQYYSTNEIRQSNGDEEVRGNDGDSSILAVTLGVGGTQSLTSILSDPILSENQKRGTLKVLFSLTDEQIKEILSL